MSLKMLVSVFQFICGCSVGIAGMGGICYLGLKLACRRDELLKLNELEGITPSFTYDPYTQMVCFETHDYPFYSKRQKLYE